jgi:hypothetical protein
VIAIDSHNRHRVCGKPPITLLSLRVFVFACLSGRNHRGARRIKSPADGKNRMRPWSSQCVRITLGQVMLRQTTPAKCRQPLGAPPAPNEI